MYQKLCILSALSLLIMTMPVHASSQSNENLEKILNESLDISNQLGKKISAAATSACNFVALTESSAFKRSAKDKCIYAMKASIASTLRESFWFSISKFPERHKTGISGIVESLIFEKEVLTWEQKIRLDKNFPWEKYPDFKLLKNYFHEKTPLSVLNYFH